MIRVALNNPNSLDVRLYIQAGSIAYNGTTRRRMDGRPFIMYPREELHFQVPDCIQLDNMRWSQDTTLFITHGIMVQYSPTERQLTLKYTSSNSISKPVPADAHLGVFHRI